MNAPTPLHGLRMIVIEDEALVAMVVEDFLDELGCIVVGTAGSVAQGMKLTERGHVEFDAAILDVNLGGEKVFPIAEQLVTLGKPFLFATGYGAIGIDPRFADRPVLTKPFQRKDLERRLDEALR